METEVQTADGSALESGDPNARVQALRAILERQDRTCVDRVADLLTTEEHPKVRLVMIYVLGKVGGQRHVAPLVRFLTSADAEIRYRTVEALGRIGDAEAGPLLVRALAADPSERVRDVAAHFVLRSGKDEVLSLFKRMLRSDQVWMRKAAILSCQRFNSPLVVPLLKLACLKETDNLKEMALGGLKKLAGLGNEAAALALEDCERAANAPPSQTPELEPPPAHGDLDATYTGARLPPHALEATPFSSSSAGFSGPPKGDPLSGAVTLADPEPHPKPRTTGSRVPVAARKSRTSATRVRTLRTSDGEPPTSAPGACPICGEEVQAGASRCQFCNGELPPPEPQPQDPVSRSATPPLSLSVVAPAYGLVQIASVVAYLGGAGSALPWGAAQAVVVLVGTVGAMACWAGFRLGWWTWWIAAVATCLTGIWGLLIAAVTIAVLVTDAVRTYASR